MATHAFETITVTGVNAGGEQEEIVKAHTLALKLFETDLVSPLSPVEHNSGQSFCVFPSWGALGRRALQVHRDALQAFRRWLTATQLDYVATGWSDTEPAVLFSHDSALIEAAN